MSFLDYEKLRIRRYIRSKQKLITLHEDVRRSDLIEANRHAEKWTSAAASPIRRVRSPPVWSELG